MFNGRNQLFYHTTSETNKQDVIDCLRMNGVELKELTDRLTVLVLVTIRIDAHFLSSQVGIKSKSDYLLGQLERIFQISDSEKVVEEEK